MGILSNLLVNVKAQAQMGRGGRLLLDRPFGLPCMLENSATPSIALLRLVRCLGFSWSRHPARDLILLAHWSITNL
jgi:hypothetical protein